MIDSIISAEIIKLIPVKLAIQIKREKVWSSLRKSEVTIRQAGSSYNSYKAAITVPSTKLITNEVVYFLPTIPAVAQKVILVRDVMRQIVDPYGDLGDIFKLINIFVNKILFCLKKTVSKSGCDIWIIIWRIIVLLKIFHWMTFYFLWVRICQRF